MNKPCWIDNLKREGDRYTFRHTAPSAEFPEKLAKLRELFPPPHGFRLLRGGTDWCWCVPATAESRNLLYVVFENAEGAFKALDRRGREEADLATQEQLF